LSRHQGQNHPLSGWRAGGGAALEPPEGLEWPGTPRTTSASSSLASPSPPLRVLQRGYLAHAKSAPENRQSSIRMSQPCNSTIGPLTLPPPPGTLQMWPPGTTPRSGGRSAR
jgi:hypothetical protein